MTELFSNNPLEKALPEPVEGAIRLFRNFRSFYFGYAQWAEISATFRVRFCVLMCCLVALCSCSNHNSVVLSQKDDYVVVYEGDTSGYDCMAAYDLIKMIMSLCMKAVLPDTIAWLHTK